MRVTTTPFKYSETLSGAGTVAVGGIGVFVGTGVFVGAGVSVGTDVGVGGTGVEAGAHPLNKTVSMTNTKNTD